MAFFFLARLLRLLYGVENKEHARHDRPRVPLPDFGKKSERNCTSKIVDNSRSSKGNFSQPRNSFLSLASCLLDVHLHCCPLVNPPSLSSSLTVPPSPKPRHPRYLLLPLLHSSNSLTFLSEKPLHTRQPDPTTLCQILLSPTVV